MTSLGLGQFKRRCLAPFECRNGRIVGSDASYGCKCATDEMIPSACQYCDFQAGGFGQHCSRCLGGLFLQADNRCHDDCDGTGLIEYNPGNCEITDRSLGPGYDRGSGVQRLWRFPFWDVLLIEGLGERRGSFGRASFAAYVAFAL